jgi:hypothetical protein
MRFCLDRLIQRLPSAQFEKRQMARLSRARLRQILVITYNKI